MHALIKNRDLLVAHGFTAGREKAIDMVEISMGQQGFLESHYHEAVQKPLASHLQPCLLEELRSLERKGPGRHFGACQSQMERYFGNQPGYDDRFGIG